MTPDEVKARRERLGMTQAQLARAFGVPRVTVNRWERGKQGVGLPTIVALAFDHLSGQVFESMPDYARGGQTLVGKSS
jgi:transcriptional regulator with XRE-family HTH domain